MDKLAANTTLLSNGARCYEQLAAQKKIKHYNVSHCKGEWNR